MVQQMAIRDQLVIVSVPLLCPNKRIKLFQKDPGQKNILLLRQAPDTDIRQLRWPFSTVSAMRTGRSIYMAIVKVV